MRAVVQRTDAATVTVGNDTVADVGRGLTVFLGVEQGDSEADAKYLADKIVNLRIFPDDAGKMNLSLLDIRGELLVVSQFTLAGDCRKGRRPSFDLAAHPSVARVLYQNFVECCEATGVKVSCGRFQEEMIVRLTNHGPVTMLLDSRRNF